MKRESEIDPATRSSAAVDGGVTLTIELLEVCERRAASGEPASGSALSGLFRGLAGGAAVGPDRDADPVPGPIAEGPMLR
jgi:hypothetical protein